MQGQVWSACGAGNLDLCYFFAGALLSVICHPIWEPQAKAGLRFIGGNTTNNIVTI